MVNSGKFDGTLVSSADEIFERDHIPDDEKPISAERALWLSVVARAWFDAFEASDWFLVHSERKRADPALIRQEARRWLILDFGNWAEDRETVCDLAGLDPAMIRDAARRRLAIAKREEAEKHEAGRMAKVIEIDRAFSALLERSEEMAALDIDKALAELATMESAA